MTELLKTPDRIIKKMARQWWPQISSNTRLVFIPDNGITIYKMPIYSEHPAGIEDIELDLFSNGTQGFRMGYGLQSDVLVISTKEINRQ